MKKIKKSTIQETLHNTACWIFIGVGVIGIIRLVLYIFFHNSNINLVRYLIFGIFEVLLGIFGIIELKKKYLIRRMK